MSIMTAISGLLINSDYMNTISNNIANASTIGYKSSKPVFFNIFSHSIYSNTAPQGFGVGISNVIQNFNNGTLIETGRYLDLGIVKEGFFRVSDSQGHIHYTRNGQFALDKNKNIINMQGMYLIGQNKSYFKNNINDLSNLEPINLKRAQIFKAQPTSKIKLKVILNGNMNSINNQDNVNNDLSKLSEYNTYIKIYNKNAEEKKMNISFNQIDKNTWKVNVQSDDNSIVKEFDSNFDLKFKSDGELNSNANFTIKSNNSQYNDISLDLTDTFIKSDVNSSLEEFFQDGYEQGDLKTFEIDPNGEIIGTYSNEQTQPIGRILLSKFINPEKLKYESGNLWSVTEESGPEEIGIAGDLGFGILTPKNLEASNVDLNQELINMIIAQRNYQSNAQSFKTEDKIISTLINLR